MRTLGRTPSSLMLKSGSPVQTGTAAGPGQAPAGRIRRQSPPGRARSPASAAGGSGRTAPRGRPPRAPVSAWPDRRKHGQRAVPARRDDGVVQIVQRADDELDRLTVAVGQVADPGRRPARAVLPVLGKSERRTARGVARTCSSPSLKSGANASRKSGHAPPGLSRSSSGRAVAGNDRRASRSHRPVPGRTRPAARHRSPAMTSTVSTTGADAGLSRSGPRRRECGYKRAKAVLPYDASVCPIDCPRRGNRFRYIPRVHLTRPPSQAEQWSQDGND